MACFPFSEEKKPHLCLFVLRSPPRCIRPHPGRAGATDEELDYAWRFSIEAGVPVAPLSDSDMKECKYDFNCMFVKRVAFRQGIFDSGRARLKNAEER